jgi:hypothetical protein
MSYQTLVFFSLLAKLFTWRGAGEGEFISSLANPISWILAAFTKIFGVLPSYAEPRFVIHFPLNEKSTGITLQKFITKQVASVDKYKAYSEIKNRFAVIKSSKV